MRAQIVLRCAEPGAVYERIASDLGVTTMTVGSWRKRFAAARVDGLATATGRAAEASWCSGTRSGHS